MQASAIVLAGGKSTRMRTNKALLEIDREQMIEVVVKKLKPIFHDLLVVTNEPDLYSNLGVRLVRDIILGQSPLCGMHAGLISAKYEYSFVVACDMPFIEPSLIKYLVSESRGYDVVVPQIDDYLQPLHAVYSKKCIAPIQDCLEHDIKKVLALYHQVRVKFIGMNRLPVQADLEKVFFNVNTPEDLKKARDLVEIK